MRIRSQVLLHLGAVTAIVVIAAGPLLLAVGAGTFATANGCALDEGSVHPCVVYGHDYGETLYGLGVMGWYSLVTLPVGALLLVVYLIVAVIVYVVRAARRATPRG